MFLAVQLLWLNLVTNGIQDVALAFEKGDKSVMNKPPRKPDESIFDKLMNSQIIVSGAIIAIIVFALWYHLIYNLHYEEAHARTVVMMLMVLLQNFHAINCRSETKSIFRLPIRNNYVLIGGVVVAQLVHIAASYIPGLSTALHLDPITFSECGHGAGVYGTIQMVVGQDTHVENINLFLPRCCIPSVLIISF